MKAKKTKRNGPKKPFRQAKKKRGVMRERPKMPLISEEMKQWSAMLRTEVSGWPQFSSRPMFGMLGVYRGRKIFAALPVSRAIGTANSVAFRISPMPPDLQQRALSESRLAADGQTEGVRRWHTFEIGSTEDLRDALWWLNQAYERAK